jgi:hypothetical protein
MQKVLAYSAILCYNPAMETIKDTARIEDLSPADLQDYLDWLDGIQK